MKTRFCKFCNTSHTLTKEFWGNPDHKSPTCKAYQRDWKVRNKEHLKTYNAALFQKNYDSIMAKRRVRYYENSTTRISESLRARLRNVLKKWNIEKKGSAVRDLGCTVPELVEFLAAKFSEGMTWENYGSWHIDHIRPLSSFDLEDREQLKQAVHYTNLQPLWAVDNIKKGNR